MDGLAFGIFLLNGISLRKCLISGIGKLCLICLITFPGEVVTLDAFLIGGNQIILGFFSLAITEFFIDDRQTENIRSVFSLGILSGSSDDLRIFDGRLIKALVQMHRNQICNLFNSQCSLSVILHVDEVAGIGFLQDGFCDLGTVLIALGTNNRRERSILNITFRKLLCLHRTFSILRIGFHVLLCGIPTGFQRLLVGHKHHPAVKCCFAVGIPVFLSMELIDDPS